MAQYLLDPIKSFEEIRDNYILYVKTAFGSRFRETVGDKPSFEDEREALLLKDQVLCREPWIEPIPAYEKQTDEEGKGMTIKDIPENDFTGMSQKSVNLYKEFISRGLMSYPLYKHQYRMLTQSLNGKDCVITSGTGSGKTESFLLPLFADIFREAVSWPDKTEKTKYRINPWWEMRRINESDFLSFDSTGKGTLNPAFLQRGNETRESAVRAIIIYPMNALVEDQMTRLRKALDSDEVQEFFDTMMGGNRIFFGRYNSESPVAGQFLKSNDPDEERMLKRRRVNMRKRLQAILADLQKQSDRIDNWVNSAADEEQRALREEQKYTFQRIHGKDDRVSSELRSRFDMQQTPPDILITNYSMLAIMLMRSAESSILEKTRQWLEGETDKEHPVRIFHLVIDELHLNRGTSGTEIAYLIRLLLNRLGLSPDSKQLRILSSSASLEGSDAKSIDFLNDFFGRTFSSANIIPGERLEPDEMFTGTDKLPLHPFTIIRDAYRNDPLSFDRIKETGDVESIVDVCSQAAKELADFAGFAYQETDGITDLLRVLISKKLALTKRFYNLFDGPLGNNRAIPLAEHQDDNNVLNKYFYDIFQTGERSEMRKAAEGLIIARGLFDIFGKSFDSVNSLPRFRFHFFFKNINGLWATVDKCDWQHNRPVGKLHDKPKIIDESNHSHRVLELLYCESCGSVFYGGRRFEDRQTGTVFILPNSPNIEDLPEKSTQIIVDKQPYSEYTVFWPVDADSPQLRDYNVLENVEHDDDGKPLKHKKLFPSGKYSNISTLECKWNHSYLNVLSGEIVPYEWRSQIPNFSEDEYVEGYHYCVQFENGTDEEKKASPALPSRCPFCGADHTKSSVHVSPLRGFRAGFSKTTQLYAKELFYQLPTKNNPKLVTFSDSREDAATVANSIERRQFEDISLDVLIELCSNQDSVSTLEQQLKEQEEGLEQMRRISPGNATILAMLEAQVQATRNQLENARTTQISRLLDSSTPESFVDSRWYKRFMELGVNPAGCDWENQEIIHDTTSYAWYEINPNDTAAVSLFCAKTHDSIISNITSLFFGNLYYGIESSGIGIITIPQKDNLIDQALLNNGIASFSHDVFMEIVNSSIRLLGEKHRYTTNRYGTDPGEVNSFKDLNKLSPIKKYLFACSRKFFGPIPENEKTCTLGQAVYDYLSLLSHVKMFLKADNVLIKPVQDTEVAYICPRCKKIHLHKSGGVCAGCFTELTNPEIIPVTTIRKRNYNLLNKTLGRSARRLHCEELTGQTDNQSERQRLFKDFVIGETPAQEEQLKKAKTIDILSVTTTMEVGVDIGSLQAVMLANMPPQRFNYQQRVGRGGRRGQSYSMILTLCRGRSHDEHFYHNPHQITGDQPPTPFLSMDRKEIARRLFTKEVLFNTFRDYERKHTYRLGGSTHGEFGAKSMWPLLSPYVFDWLTDPSNKLLIASIAHVISPRFESEMVLWATDPDKLHHEMEAALTNRDISTEDLAECLAESGLLPMYGMPTRDRQLFSGFNISKDEVAEDLSSVSRDLEMAITAFSPNSQVTKDKRVITAIGFVPSSLYCSETGTSRDIHELATRGENSAFSLKTRLWMCKQRGCSFFTTDENKLPENRDYCPECGSPLKVINLRTPNGFITDMTPGDNRQNDVGVFVNRKGVVAESRDCERPRDCKPTENIIVTLAENDFTWRINDREITGSYCNVDYKNAHYTKHIKSYLDNVEQWIANEIRNGDEMIRFGGQYGTTARIVKGKNDGDKCITKIIPRHNDDGECEIETIQLAAHKVTNVIKLMPAHPVEGINLNPFDFIPETNTLKFESQGVRAAFYSLSFILQRAIASKLDVDPREIDVVDPVKNDRMGRITLADEQLNGSGFVNDLFENFDEYVDRILKGQDDFFKKMMSDKHISDCDSSCYECLSNYNNMPYHGLLDWRLGIALFRLMVDNTYRVGLDGRFDYPELSDWKSRAVEQLKSLNESFDLGGELCTEGYIPYLKRNNGEKYIFAVHPLWKTDESNELLAEAVFDAGIGPDNYITIDTFNMLRRIGTCYEFLFQ